MIDRPTQLFAWINEQLDAGRTVYASTYLVKIKIQPKHRSMVRLHAGRVQVQRGKRWDIIDLAHFSAI